jgi:hypothetical protein
MRHTLIDERTQWMQRIQATLYHHGVSGTPEKLRTREGEHSSPRLPFPPMRANGSRSRWRWSRRSRRRSLRSSASCGSSRAARPAAKR